MKIKLICALLSTCLISAQETAEPLQTGADTAPAQTEPAPLHERFGLPTREEVLSQSIESQQQAADAVKQALIHRAFLQHADGFRLTPATAASTLHLAESLPGSPQPFLNLLRLEAGGTLYGAELHEYRLVFNKLIAAYGVDALQIRFCIESLSDATGDLRPVFAWLPLRHVFNLVPPTPLTPELFQQQLSTLADVYTRLADRYASITNREQADAAADELLPLLADYDTTAAARLRLAKQGETQRLADYQLKVQPAIARYGSSRTLLYQSAFFGSKKLALLDYLLN